MYSFYDTTIQFGRQGCPAICSGRAGDQPIRRRLLVRRHRIHRITHLQTANQTLQERSSGRIRPGKDMIQGNPPTLVSRRSRAVPHERGSITGDHVGALHAHPCGKRPYTEGCAVAGRSDQAGRHRIRAARSAADPRPRTSVNQMIPHLPLAGAGSIYILSITDRHRQPQQHL